MSETENTAETRKHIMRVGQFLNDAAIALLRRAEHHDGTKLREPEVSVFEEFTAKLCDCDYGSTEYYGYLAAMEPALDHHYANNRHHPEHYGERGILGMTLVDLIEMLADWMAASERHRDGDVMKSIEMNKKRFGISEELVVVLRNTVERW